MFRSSVRRGYSVTSIARAEANTAAAEELTVNFCTPHGPICRKRAVEMITLPGESGVFAITKGHSCQVAQLKPGVVSLAITGVLF